MRCNLIIIFSLSVVFFCPAFADVICVKADGSGDAPDIQSAIFAAAPGDSVCLPDTLYSGAGNRNISFLGKPIVVYSSV